MIRDDAGQLPPGAYAILSTPFDEAERLDLEGLSSLARFYEASGAHGLVALAVMGEGAKLTENEREEAIRTVRAASRCRLVVGVSAPGTAIVRRRIERAVALGAQGVLLAPSAGMSPEDILHLYAGAAEEGLPIVLQDHPASTGVVMSVALIASVVEEVENVVAVKNEAPPTAVRTRQILAATRSEIRVFGGLGGLSLLDELDAGAQGTMTGFAFPEVLVEVVHAYRRGDRERARTIYEAFLPWLVFESTAVQSLGIRKEFLHLRGVIRKAGLRSPAPDTDPALRRRASELHAAYAARASEFGLERGSVVG